MFDIAGTELLLLIALAIIFVGPKDLPRLMRSIGAFMRKARMVARDFQRSFEDIANEADLKDLQDDVKEIIENLYAHAAVDDKRLRTYHRVGIDENGNILQTVNNLLRHCLAALLARADVVLCEFCVSFHP